MRLKKRLEGKEDDWEARALEAWGPAPRELPDNADPGEKTKELGGSLPLPHGAHGSPRTFRGPGPSYAGVETVGCCTA